MPIYFTNQAIEVVNQLNKTGYLTGKAEFVDKDFLPSYRWMIEQMGKRLNHNGSYPIWLWTTKPNLQSEGHFNKGTKAVCLTVEIPENQILFSDFSAWHCVLNNGFCPMTEEEDTLFDDGKLTITKEQSWERIFDLAKLRNSEMWNNGDQIVQGVTPIIQKEQIVNIEYFIAK
ncbi:DUF3841 domain-containing protein [Niallia circulans]|uniref:DUF3841 domain-containing protein n=1 Tax=Niallia circulans TaxID=1397 RepID=UPI00203BB3EB|nr:DUF3841 domain-containing protein [Niallia circulans]MCM2980006.1 DUF3841 domain-containing protein [Niallia circulans]